MNSTIDEPIVYVVDDDESARDAMMALFKSVSLESQAFGSAEAFLETANDVRPGCVLVDLRMPGMSGLDLQRSLQERGCKLPVIFLSGHGDVSAAVQAMQQGAKDFLNKPADGETVLARVKEMIHADQKRHATRREQETLVARLQNLTGRQRDVLEAVVRGLTNKEIARELSISPKTVELHRSHMMHKMHAESVADVVRMYLRTADVRKRGV
ncbi:MAG: response regulator [Sinobacteraceae bacterium]|nr:response regulator [Nevskiaceae bacterium]